MNLHVGQESALLASLEGDKDEGDKHQYEANRGDGEYALMVHSKLIPLLLLLLLVLHLH